MSITDESTQKLKILSQRAKQPIEKLEAEFAEELRVLTSDVRLKLDEKGLQKKAYTRVLAKYQTILTAKKFVGFLYSKDQYFDQSRWLKSVAKLTVERQGEPLAVKGRWMNSNKELCDGRPYLDNAKTIPNPQHGNVIRDHQGNRTVRYLAFATDDKTGKPVGKLLDLRLTLNGKYGIDSAVSQDKYPANEWISFYANFNDKQKDPTVKRIKFPPNNVVEPLSDEVIADYKLEDVYTSLVQYYSTTVARKSFLLEVQSVDRQGTVNQTDKKIRNEVFIIQSDVLQVPPTSASQWGSLILDGGKELTLDGESNLENLSVKLPPYLLELINFGVGSTIIVLGTIYKPNKRDKDGKRIEGEYDKAQFNATNLIPVPGQFVSVQTEAITEDKIKEMASGTSKVKLESVTPDTDLVEGGGF